LQAEVSGVIPDDPILSNPIYVLVESKGKYVYVANQGSNTTGNNPESGIAAYDLFKLAFIPAEFHARRNPLARDPVLNALSRILPTSSFTKPMNTTLP